MMRVIDVTKWNLFLITFVLLAMAVPACAEDPAAAAIRLNETAVKCQDAGQFAAAEQAYTQAIETAHGSDLAPARRLRIALNLVSVYLEQGKYREADLLITRLQKGAPELPAGSPELGVLYNYLGFLNLIQGHLSQAQKDCKQALAILDQPDHSQQDELASVLQTLSAIQMRQGAYGEALQNADRSLAILETYGHPAQMIRLLASRSTLQYLLKNWDEAEKSARQAIEIAEQTYGPSYPALGEILQNYSLILDRLHRGKEARSFRRRARAMGVTASALTGSVVDFSELRSESGDVSVYTK